MKQPYFSLSHFKGFHSIQFYAFFVEQPNANEGMTAAHFY